MHQPHWQHQPYQNHQPYSSQSKNSSENHVAQSDYTSIPRPGQSYLAEQHQRSRMSSTATLSTSDEISVTYAKMSNPYLGSSFSSHLPYPEAAQIVARRILFAPTFTWFYVALALGSAACLLWSTIGVDCSSATAFHTLEALVTLGMLAEVGLHIFASGSFSTYLQNAPLWHGFDVGMVSSCTIILLLTIFRPCSGKLIHYQVNEVLVVVEDGLLLTRNVVSVVRLVMLLEKNRSGIYGPPEALDLEKVLLNRSTSSNLATGSRYTENDEYYL